MKVIFTSKRTIAIILFFAFGLLYALAPSERTFDHSIKTVAGIICLDGIIKLVIASKQSMGKKEYYLDICEGFVSIFVGVVAFKFSSYKYVTFSCGLIYLIFPLIRLIVVEKKLNQLLVDCLKYLAVAIFISSINKTLTSNFVLSSIFFAISILITITLVRKIIYSKKEEEVSDYE